jgi:GAF domain-containing protein
LAAIYLIALNRLFDPALYLFRIRLPDPRRRILYLCDHMDHSISRISASKEEQYEGLLATARAVIGSETHRIANMANVAALLKEQFGWHWVGFYLVNGDELVLGPFQGPVACTRIAKGKGVCGAAWQRGETIVVDDVHTFPGHIACSPLSRSEIVVPLFDGHQPIGVLDIDSDRVADFDSTDKKYLEMIAALIP